MNESSEVKKEIEKLTNKGYTPLTSRLGISGTSYTLQIGKIQNKFVAVLFKGNEVIAFTNFESLNINKIIEWTLATISIPNINPYHIRRTVHALLTSLRRDKEVIAPIAEDLFRNFPPDED